MKIERLKMPEQVFQSEPPVATFRFGPGENEFITVSKAECYYWTESGAFMGTSNDYVVSEGAEDGHAITRHGASESMGAAIDAAKELAAHYRSFSNNPN